MLQAFAKHNKMMKDFSAGKGTDIGIILTLKNSLMLKHFFSIFILLVSLQDLTVIF